MKDIQVGLVDYEVYIPENFVEAEELSTLTNIPAKILVEKFGVKRKPVGGPEDHCVTMAIKSARKLLEKTGTDPKEIDLIIYPGEEYKEYICWTGSIKIQKELKAEKCWAFDISYRCAATPVALKLAKELMITNEEIKTVLIAGGNTNAYLINYNDPNSSFMFDMGPSGHAALLKRGYEKNLILGTGIHTEPVFADDVIAPYGGTKNPITVDVVESGMWNKIIVPEPERMKKDLADRGTLPFVKPVDIALAKSGLSRADIDYLAILHIKPSAHYAILQDLGLRPEQSVYLDEYGHVGHTDQWLSLKLGLEQGKIKDGDHVVFLGAGTGYAFTSTVIRWG
ncbi:MAG: 3-oxoacyl-ACP synthase [Bacillota bacterium]|jgi:3-oxoacyl-[acyl-carrier-protein] synthase-3|nr:hypothetical protein [Peptococcaceae bacterium]